MSVLSSKFDIVTREATPLAHAALAEVLDSGPMSVDAQGTPVAGTIAPGTIVAMGTAGEAVEATSPAAAAPPILMFTVLDGDTELSGAFTRKLSCLQGGFKMVTENFTGAGFVPGDPLSVNVGVLKAQAAGEQIYGYVGPEGLITSTLLSVIVPQGACAGAV